MATAALAAAPLVAAEPAPREAVDAATPLDIDGRTFPLAALRGRVLLIVNTASLGGNTWQYRPLQTLQARTTARA